MNDEHGIPDRGRHRRHLDEGAENTTEIPPSWPDDPPTEPTSPVDRGGAAHPTDTIAPVGDSQGDPGMELLTHREPTSVPPSSAYGSASNSGPMWHGAQERGAGEAGRMSARRHEDDDGNDDDGHPNNDSSSFMSAAARRVKQMRQPKPKGRTVRRICYAAAALLIGVPLIAFVIGYFIWDVESPEQVAAEQEQTVSIKFSDGSNLTNISPSGGNRILVKDLDRQVPQHMQDATVAAEDASFWSNPGFDVVGIVRAAWNQVTGGSGGGSTLTQQYIKLTTGNDEDSYFRKFKEVVLAFKMSNQQPKKEIMRAYLNTAYYGRGANGVQAAAQAFFGKDAKDLRIGESALLAGMVQLPNAHDPAVDLESSKARWNYVMDQMVANHFITPQQRASEPYPQTLSEKEWRPKELTGPRGQIRNQVLTELAAAGYSEQDLQLGGYTIVTNIDPKAQAAAENAVHQTMAGQPNNLRPALVATDPKTGGVRAYYGGEDPGGFDYAKAPQQPGSAFKPFVALAGLEQGRGLGETYDGSSPRWIAGTQFRNAEGSCPTCSVREAMTRSVNTVFVDMAVQFGLPKVAEAAYQAGIPREVGGKETLRNPAGGPPDAGLALGQYPVSTFAMADAYGTFANNGQRIPARFVAQLKDPQGNVVRDFGPHPKPAFAPNSPSRNSNLAANVTESMLQVASHSGVPLVDGRPVAAKTGTHQFLDTNDSAKAWMVGYTPQMSAAVSLGASGPSGKEEPVRNANGSIVYGKDLPGKIWQKFMSDYHANLPVEQFIPAKPIGKYAEQVPVTTESSTRPPSRTSQTPTPSSSPESTTESSTPSRRPTSFPGCPSWLCPGGNGEGNGENNDGNNGGNSGRPPGDVNGNSPTETTTNQGVDPAP